MSPSKLSSFVYDDLNLKESSVRLLQVEPTLIGGRISCKLKHAVLPASYNALSYTWGTDQARRRILVNGAIFHVNENLFQFLKIARTMLPNQAIWIDAISINQVSPMEKNHQVTQMGRIYRGAQKVYIWLGQDCPWTASLFEDVRQVCSSDGNDIQGVVDQVLSKSHTTKLQNCVLEMYTNPYWRRVWIVQELLLARTIEVVAAKVATPWPLVLEIFIWLSFWDPPYSIFERKFGTSDDDNEPKKISFLDSRAMSLTWLKSEHRANIVDHFLSSSFRELFADLGILECSDPRDRLYGLLSLVKNGGLFAVDYDENCKHLFFRALYEFDFDWTTDLYKLLAALSLKVTDVVDSTTPFDYRQMLPSSVHLYPVRPTADTENAHPADQRWKCKSPECVKEFRVHYESGPFEVYTTLWCFHLFVSQAEWHVILMPVSTKFEFRFVVIGMVVPTSGLDRDANEKTKLSFIPFKPDLEPDQPVKECRITRVVTGAGAMTSDILWSVEVDIEMSPAIVQKIWSHFPEGGSQHQIIPPSVRIARSF